MTDTFPQSGPVDLVTVRVFGLPLPIHARAQEHADALRREFQLIAEQMHGEHAQEGGTDPSTSVPPRLLKLIETLGQQYSGFTLEQEDRIDAGIAAGEPSVDLEFQVPASAAQAALALGEMLDEADAYCREGRHLLTLATPPDLVAYRRWYLDEFIRQIAGEAPRPWPALRSLNPPG